MTTRIVSCVGIKAMSCDSLNKGNTFLIPGQALLTPVTAVTFLQESGGKSPFCLWGRSKDATSSDIPSILKSAHRSDLGTGVPVNLVILTRRLPMCDLLYPPHRRKCHPFRKRHLVTMRLTPLWAARLLLSPPHCQIAFVPSVTLMYEKFKMSLV